MTKDVNSDGHVDVVLGAPGAGISGNVTGMVFILLGEEILCVLFSFWLTSFIK